MQEEIFGVEWCMKLDEEKFRKCREKCKIITYNVENIIKNNIDG